MPHAELIEWSEYSQIEPFGSHYDDLRAGTIAAAAYNIARDIEKRPEPFMPLDFTPWNSLSEGSAKGREPVFLEDPEAQSARFDLMIFGRVAD